MSGKIITDLNRSIESETKPNLKDKERKIERLESELLSWKQKYEEYGKKKIQSEEKIINSESLQEQEVKDYLSYSKDQEKALSMLEWVENRIKILNEDPEAKIMVEGYFIKTLVPLRDILESENPAKYILELDMKAAEEYKSEPQFSLVSEKRKRGFDIQSERIRQNIEAIEMGVEPSSYPVMYIAVPTSITLM
jgi:hypothetical protein